MRLAVFVVCPLSCWCSISINTHGACWQRCGRKMCESIAGCSSCRGFYESSQRSMVNWEHSLFPLITQISLYRCFYFSFQPSILVCRGYWNGRVCGWRAEVVWKSKRLWSGSKEVCGRWGLGAWHLSVGLQKVNYVFVGGSFCHQQCCLTILRGSRKSQFHVKDYVVTALILTVAVLLLL